MTEFELIQKYFSAQDLKLSNVNVGIGDDAAIITPPPQQQIILTTDTLVAGVHFLTSTQTDDIGYKALAVNLSDLAAMGATPAWVLLAVTLPEANEAWVKAFCDGFFSLANRYHVQLIGGDLTQGPLCLTVQALGYLPPGEALLRSNAKSGDLIYVTGTLGDAGLALQHLLHQFPLADEVKTPILTRLHRPEPRVSIGEKIRTIAHAAIDISDGLAADLSHLLQQSQVGAIVNVDSLPFSKELLQTLSLEQAISLALSSGDDYELCFTIPKNQQAHLEQTLSTLNCRYTCIGRITTQPGLKLQFQNGTPYEGITKGYEHF